MCIYVCVCMCVQVLVYMEKMAEEAERKRQKAMERKAGKESLFCQWPQTAARVQKLCSNKFLDAALLCLEGVYCHRGVALFPGSSHIIVTIITFDPHKIRGEVLEILSCKHIT